MKKMFLALSLSLILVFNNAFGEMDVYFLDVGQGDCAIIVADGDAMIIDGGSASYSDLVYTYIKNTLKLEHIAYMVATHPHEDHIGGLAAALKAVPVDIILTPVLSWNTDEFKNLLDYADMRECTIRIPADGDTYPLGTATITILMCWPEANLYSSVNDMSIVLRIDYGSTSFLFTGDAEAYVEYTLVDNWDLSADVLKVGHHGSISSSTDEFITAVNPNIAVISCGKNNPYGHPRQEILDKLSSLSSDIYRTDLQGTVIVHSNGESLSVKTDKDIPVNRIHEAPIQSLNVPQNCYIGNNRTMKFHRPECKWAASISESNRIIFKTREEALNAYFIPCGSCNP